MMALEILLMEYRENKRPFPTYAELIGLCSAQANNAGQVAPQATVELLTDAITRLERMDSTQDERFAAADELRTLIGKNILQPIPSETSYTNDELQYIYECQCSHENGLRIVANSAIKKAVKTIFPIVDERFEFDKFEKRIGRFARGWEAWNARALLATPPTSKETDDENRLNFEMLIRTVEIIAVGDAPDPVSAAANVLCAIGYWDKIGSQATSKADTGEALPHQQTSIRSKGDYYDAGQMRDYRNAALKEAALIAEETDIAEYGRGHMRQDDGSQTRSDIALYIRAAKSATPSTIKTEPTGEQL